MSRTIFKYPLQPGQRSLSLPRGSQVRSVIEQHGELVCYAEVDETESATEPHSFFVYGTGHTIRHNGGQVKFLGTVALDPHVFHVFHQPPTKGTNEL